MTNPLRDFCLSLIYERWKRKRYPDKNKPLALEQVDSPYAKISGFVSKREINPGFMLILVRIAPPPFHQDTLKRLGENSSKILVPIPAYLLR